MTWERASDSDGDEIVEEEGEDDDRNHEDHL